MSAILRELDEAGEEDLCVLANALLSDRPEFGSDASLEYLLTAVHRLRAARRVRLRRYRVGDPRPLTGKLLEDPFAAIPWIEFDPDRPRWRWRGEPRVNVELE